MSARLVCAVLALLLSLAAPVCAQGKRYALLVGVTDYDSSAFPTLKYAENDAEKLAEVLKASGYDEVVVLTTSRGKKDDKTAPTAANVRAALEKLSNKVKRDDLLLIALSGHGVQWPVVDDKTKKEKGESFFCPSDARPRSDQTLAQLKKTMIPLGELFRALEESGAGVRLMLVDACRNEVKGAGRNIDVDNLPRTKKGTAVLFSCKGGERAFEVEKYKHGVFFHHVIDALKSKKDLTWSQLSDHVTDKVTEDVPELIGGGARQTPHEMKNLEGRSPLLLPPRKKADKVEAQALYELGQKYRSGSGVEKDAKKAVECFRKAADKGHVLATYYLGDAYAKGQGVEKDEKEAVKWLRKVADGGDADATYYLGAMYAAGRGVEKDDKEAVKWFRKAAGGGEANSMCSLGTMYLTGRGVEKDEKEAVKWFRKAVEKGNAAAMYCLGVTYAKGQGVEKDEKEAVKWLRKAADGGDTDATYYLGAMYAAGRGVEKDDKEAVKWFRKAAGGGEANSMCSLGTMYLTGRGVEKDEKEAVKWFRKAVEKGNAAAMYCLGVTYKNGDGVEKDDKEAARWYRKAADEGYPAAMFLLGVSYELGSGIGKDAAEALKWYKKAATLGDEDAKKKVKELESKS